MLLFYHIKKLLSRIFARFIINSCVFNQIIHKIPFKLAFFDKLMKLTFKKLLIFALFILIFKLKVYKKIRTSTYSVMCGLKPILILNTNKIQENICAEIPYIQDCRLDFFQILNGV